MGEYKEVVVYATSGVAMRFEKCWNVQIEGKLLTFSCNDTGVGMMHFFRLDSVAGWGIQS